jgi:hypothetical protein
MQRRMVLLIEGCNLAWLMMYLEFLQTLAPR